MHIYKIFQLSNIVLSNPAHKDIYYFKHELPDPILLGFEESYGEPKGQKSDLRYPLPDGRVIHMIEYDHVYAIHWDKVNPKKNPIEHLRRDSPFYYTLLCGTIGGLVGAGIGRKSKDKKNTVKYALSLLVLGLLFGVCTAEWE